MAVWFSATLKVADEDITGAISFKLLMITVIVTCEVNSESDAETSAV